MFSALIVLSYKYQLSHIGSALTDFYVDSEPQLLRIV